MENFGDTILFKNKSLSDLFEEIYENSVSKKQQIKGLVEQLYPLIEGIGDATLLVPLIKEYMEIGVKNDEQLIKLAQIVQRLGNNKQAAGSADDLWASLAASLETDEQITKEVETVTKEVEEVVPR